MDRAKTKPEGPLLVLGSTGMAGSAIMSAAAKRGLTSLGLSRSSKNRCLDVLDIANLRDALDEIKPRCIINTIALVSIDTCENDPGLAWTINARPVATLAQYANASGARLIQVSTDHYFTGGGKNRHTEESPVALMNEYARTKFAAECLAMTNPSALVARTNIVGVTGRKNGSFAEWCCDAIANNRDVTLFTDQHVSSIDIWSFADCLLDLVDNDCAGLLNIASSEVFSKAEFATAMAKQLGVEHSNAKYGNVSVQATNRAESLGLDVRKAERILGRKMPTLKQVITTLCRHF